MHGLKNLKFILKTISATEFDWIRSSAEQNLHY